MTGHARVAVPLLDLRDTPRGARQRQLVFGAAVTLQDQRDGWAHVTAAADGYSGWVETKALGPDHPVTHRVATLGTHAYAADDIKSPDLLDLPFGARITVLAEGKVLNETPFGFVPKKHLRPLDRPFSDPATVAQMFFGAPYLWGGNSARGIDCSGLVQGALLACDIPCPGDSTPQRAEAGQPLPPGTPPARGDLVFWAGHVGIMVDGQTLLHANAHAMACVYEPLEAATLRIKAQDGGDVLALRRPRS